MRGLENPDIFKQTKITIKYINKMKKILFLIMSVMVLTGCQSREEKAVELIKQDMFKTLYDFESYEPIETKIDSAFTSIYSDTLALLYATQVKEMFDELDDAKTDYELANSSMEIWADSYSTLGRYKFNEAKEKVNNYINKINNTLKIANSIYEKIKKRNLEIGHNFIGWKAQHKFRCKTKGGNFDLGDYIYVFDKDMKSIIYKEDLDNDSNDRLKGLINEAINTEDKKNEQGDAQSAEADSLSRAIK